MVKNGKFDTLWGKIPGSKNVELLFECAIEVGKQNIVIEFIAKDIYNLFVNGKFVSYGPARAAKGYARMEHMDISSFLKTGKNIVSLYVQANGTKTMHIAEGDPFLGVRIYANGELVRETKDFTCYLVSDKLQKVERMSSQRGYLEIYDVKGAYPELELKEVPCPLVMKRRTSYSMNKMVKAKYLLSGRVEINETNVWENDFTRLLDLGDELDSFARDACDCVLSKELLSFDYQQVNDTDGLLYYIYEFPHVYAGKFKIQVKISGQATIWITYDDILKDGYLKFNREHIIHGLKWTLHKGEHTLYSQEVYAAKYIQIITDKNVEIEDVSIICIENPDVKAFVIPIMDEELRTIVAAAQNSLAQNAYDIFTDCPTRERSGFLCDSYFMGKAEHFFTGQNKVEKDFLENYLLYDGTLFKHKGIMPMCYPAQPMTQEDYIPAWILWYVIELKDYQKRTGDDAFIELHTQRLADILDFFQTYENEYELLENLEGWVFVEWSKATDFVDGVNFPTNILYAEMIRAVGEMLGDSKLLEKAERIRLNIRNMAFDGKLYVDNAVRVDGQLQLTQNVSEFCQIIAAYFKMEPEDSLFYQNFKARFVAIERNLPPAALFIGTVLRLMTLYQMGEFELLLKECKEQFLEMAQTTGTIWELFGGNASCNHGFGAIVGQLICEAVMRIKEQEGEFNEAI